MERTRKKTCAQVETVRLTALARELAIKARCTPAGPAQVDAWRDVANALSDASRTSCKAVQEALKAADR